MKNKLIYILFALISCQYVSAQDFTFKNQNKIMGTLNPSFYGFGDSSKAGVIYNTEGFNDSSKIDSRFGFTNYYFDQSEFSLALDVNSIQIGNLGYANTTANLHYIYKTKFDNDWVFNPSLSVGFGNSKLDYSSMVFGDQLNVLTGSIAGVSADPVNTNNKVNYLDIGAGASIHNSKNLFFGLNLKHLNQPNTSFNTEASNKTEILGSVQAGYQHDINPFGQNPLPEFSYLVLYNSYSMQGSKSRFDLYQELILGNVSVGINEHFNHFDGFSISQLGTSLSVFVEQIEVGANYSFDVGSNKVGGASYNTFEIYITFDFNRFKKNRRGDNNKFFGF